MIESRTVAHYIFKMHSLSSAIRSAIPSPYQRISIKLPQFNPKTHEGPTAKAGETSHRLPRPAVCVVS